MLYRLLFSILLFSLNACTSLPTPHRFDYDFTDNRSVTLLEWEWADKKSIHRPRIRKEISEVTAYLQNFGEELKIKWTDKKTNLIKIETIQLKKGLPLSIRNSEIRLIFNKENKPEVFIFYNGPDPYTYFKFKGQGYVNRRARQIHPIIKELDSEDLENLRR